MKRRAAGAVTPTTPIGIAARVKSLEKQLGEADGKVADLEVELKHANEKYAEATRRMVDLEEDIDDLRGDKKLLEDKISKAESAERRVAAAEKGRSEAATRVQALQKEVAGLRKQLEAAKKAPPAPRPAPKPAPAPAPPPKPRLPLPAPDPELEKKLEAARKQISDLTLKQTELTQRLTKLTTKNTELTKQVSEEKKHAADVLQQLNQQTRRVNELQKMARSQANDSAADATREREIISLRAELDTARDGVREARTRADKAEKELLEATKRIDELERHGDAGRLICPRCNGKMVEFDHLGVTLDRCTECDGLYFDAGELEEVLQAEFPDSFDVGDDTAEVEIGSLQGAGEFDEDDDTFVEDDEEPAPKQRGSGFFKSLFRRKKNEE